MTMQNHSPLSDLIAIAILNSLVGMSPPSKANKAAKPEQPDPAPATEPKADTRAPSTAKFLDLLSPVEFLDLLLDAAPAPAVPHNTSDQEPITHIHKVGVIPHDIAERCGMNTPDYDHNSLVGSTVAMLACALTSLRELQSQQATRIGASKCQMADQNIGAAIAALGLLEPATPTTTA